MKELITPGSANVLPYKDAAESPGVSKLAATVAHELNNPLDAVLRFVSLAQRKAKTGDYSDIERYLTDAQFGLQRMAEILRELMDIGRETNALMTKSAPVALADLITGAVRTAAGQAEQKGLTLAVKNLMPANIAMNYDLRVSQVLSNLLKNAVEASPEGGTVRVTIQLATTEEKEWVRIVVEDCGAGLPENLLLFTPFVTTKPRGAGNGLGLAISRELIQSLGGTLTVANRAAPLSGCVATMTLPLILQMTGR